jgi:hypothetical protein
MALTHVRLSSIEPFGFIDCPVCGGCDFVAMDPDGGVWCEHCNAEFRVRTTGGDAGCVVDAFFDTVSGECRSLLAREGFFVRPYAACTSELASVYAYRTLKEPNEHGGSDDDRGWIVAARDFGAATARTADGRPLWEYLRRDHCLATPGELRWLRGFRGPRAVTAASHRATK